jgi:hypothetical protein
MTPNQQIAVMVLGGLIVVASLLLLFLKKEEGQNRIKVWGQELEISTPSLVVFLAGCGIFVLPLFLPVQHPTGTPVRPAENMARTANTNQQSNNEQKSDNVITLPPFPLSEAPVPNDRIQQATPIVFGSSIGGKLTKSDPIDWYTFKTPEAIGDDILIIYRFISGNSVTNIVVYDAVLQSSSTYGESKSIRVAAEKNRTYFVKIHGD